MDILEVLNTLLEKVLQTPIVDELVVAMFLLLAMVAMASTIVLCVNYVVTLATLL